MANNPLALDLTDVDVEQLGMGFEADRLSLEGLATGDAINELAASCAPVCSCCVSCCCCCPC